MEKIGFFGGCFNPPTIAHLELAKLALKKYNLSKVIFVPMGNSYEKKGLIDQKHRYNMLKILTKDEPNLDVTDLEFGKKMFAIEAFELIDSMYKCEKYFIMGSDNYNKIDTWKQSEKLKKFNFIVLNRESKENLQFINSNLINISSTIVRDAIKDGKSKYLTNEVYEYIKNNKLYLENED